MFQYERSKNNIIYYLMHFSFNLMRSDVEREKMNLIELKNESSTCIN